MNPKLQPLLKSPWHTAQVDWAGVRFHIARMAAAGRGSFPGLWTYVQPQPRLLLGHAESGRYAVGAFRRLPPHKLVTVADASYLLASENLLLVEELHQKLVHVPESQDLLATLFEKPFAHMTVSTEWHVGGIFLLRRKTLLRYTALPEEIYQDPQLLSRFLNDFSQLAKLLGVRFESEHP